MRRTMTNFAAALPLATTAAGTAVAEKPGGILRIPFVTSPASMSIHEESTIAALGPMMGVFNNLVMFDQHVKQNSLSSIVPDLAESWTYAEDGKSLTFTLREGVKWHDGKPFTAKDVKCTIDLLQGKAKDSLRKNPREGWYKNVAEVKVNNYFEVTFHLNRPQPALLALLASGHSPFDSAELRRAMAFTIDRKAFVDILSEGKADIGASMLPPPAGVWGMPAEMLQTVPGYGPDIQANRAQARKIMERLGYGPNKRLA